MAEGETNNWTADVQTLLDQSKVCFLATLGQNGPETSMAPYAIHNATILLHLSKLARHTANIESSPTIGLMICTPETPADSPLALPRLSLQGKATPVGETEFKSAKSAYLKAIPDAEPLFSFADFSLFQLIPSAIHWVGGFGSARKIAVSDWRALFAENEGEMP
jgi:putative heme iron utilization protein